MALFIALLAAALGAAYHAPRLLRVIFEYDLDRSEGRG